MNTPTYICAQFAYNQFFPFLLLIYAKEKNHRAYAENPSCSFYYPHRPNLEKQVLLCYNYIILQIKFNSITHIGFF